MIHEELQKLERLSAQVTRKLHHLQEENQSLKEELEKKEQLLEEKEASLDYFKNQIKISKIVNNLPVENVDSAELRNRINNYIKEIDKIITYLSE
ncbi:hypothetical protein QWY93_11560 [Echinicola jeungdonensis]|uniref:Uncharacterized protein n=1 Tax=Echinicola jeungdonensis TaxID=709343 RepID=A0ABV5J906_9BACT|nr:hypothetical protein [Echinicola jeungdonensis]MDN3669963.1 hypothetical protein [Echinicola jeungdonensis]